MIFTSTSVSAETALRLVQAVRDHAVHNGWNVAVAVVDRQGVPLAALRMDGATPPILDFASDKAFTAATMRRSTTALFERMNSVPSLRLGLANRQRLAVWGGGLPIVLEGQVIGGIGVSGASDEEDIACAKAALAAEGLDFEP